MKIRGKEIKRCSHFRREEFPLCELFYTSRQGMSSKTDKKLKKIAVW